VRWWSEISKEVVLGRFGKASVRLPLNDISNRILALHFTTMAGGSVKRTAERNAEHLKMLLYGMIGANVSPPLRFFPFPDPAADDSPLSRVI
jgi:hypothetical protein